MSGDYTATFDALAPPELGLEFTRPAELPVRVGLDRAPLSHHVPDGPYPFKVLLSYWYYKKTDLDALAARFPQGAQFIADSGAFSAKTKGVDIDVDEYGAWIDRWHDRLVAYSNLDVIGDAVGTARNQARMEERGYDPFPVFHIGEDFAYLEAYCDQYQYVALGGMVGGQNEFLKTWIAKCFIIAERTGTRFHGFGQTSVDLLELFPWYSVDSSSWAGGHRWASLYLWDDAASSMVQTNFRTEDPHSVDGFEDLIREHGVDPILFTDPLAYHYTDALKVNAYAWHRYAQHLRELHGPITLSGNTDGVHCYSVFSGNDTQPAVSAQHLAHLDGLHLYFVDSNTTILAAAARHLQTKGDAT